MAKNLPNRHCALCLSHLVNMRIDALFCDICRRRASDIRKGKRFHISVQNRLICYDVAEVTFISNDFKDGLQILEEKREIKARKI